MTAVALLFVAAVMVACGGDQKKNFGSELDSAEPAVAQELRRIVESVDCRDLHKLADRVSNALNNMGTGLNQQLVLEDLLISWADLPRIDIPGVRGHQEEKRRAARPEPFIHDGAPR